MYKSKSRFESRRLFDIVYLQGEFGMLSNIIIMLLAQFNMWFWIAFDFPFSHSPVCVCACTTRYRSLFSLLILCTSELYLYTFCKLASSSLVWLVLWAIAVFASPPLSFLFSFFFFFCLATRNSNLRACNYIIVWAMLDAHIHVTDNTQHCDTSWAAYNSRIDIHFNISDGINHLHLLTTVTTTKSF